MYVCMYIYIYACVCAYTSSFVETIRTEIQTDPKIVMKNKKN